MKLREILGAVARRWCTKENEHETMDSDLAMAIARELTWLFEKWSLEMVGEDEPEVRRSEFGITQTDAYLTAKDRVRTGNVARQEIRRRIKEEAK